MDQFKEEVKFFAIVMVITLVVLFVLSIFTGCATWNPDPSVFTPSAKTPYDRRDLHVLVNGVDIRGSAVIDRSKTYLIRVYPEDSIDRIIWTTCNRQVVVDKPSNGFWGDFTGDKTYHFTLTPVNGLEDDSACPIEITVLTEKKNRTGFAFIDFTDGRPEFTIPAILKCNGSVSSVLGVSVCQSAENLVQEIIFDRPVIPGTPDVGCQPMTDVDGGRTRYRWSIAAGKCTYLFGDKNKNRLRLSSIGYNEVPYRGN